MARIKPTPVPVAPERKSEDAEPVTVLATPEMDAKDVSGDDGSDSPENSANKDVAEAQKIAQDPKADPAPSYFHGMGGAADV